MYKILFPFRFLIKRRISYFAVLAVAICVFVVLVVMTVLSGLTSDFKNKTHLSEGDCIISTKSLVGFGYYNEFAARLEKSDFVEAVAPVVKGYSLALFRDADKRLLYDRGLELIGIDPAEHGKITPLKQWVSYHSRDIENLFSPVYDPALPGCAPAIGTLFEKDSQGRFQVPAKAPQYLIEIIGFPLSAKGALLKVGVGEVSSKIFYSSDFVQTGLPLDWNTIYLPLEQAQILFGMDSEPKRVTALYVKFKNGTELNAGCEKVNQLWQQFVKDKAGLPQADLLKKVTVQSWRMYSRKFVAVAETQQTMMILVFCLIGIITVFIVFVVFYMIISHKSKDIGIMKSVGVSATGVLTVFVNFAFLIGAAGSAIGVLVGWQFLVHINHIEAWLYKHFNFQLWNRRIYAIGEIPNTIDPTVLTTIVFCAVAACVIGAIIPSRRAAGIKPAETLQVSQL